VAWRGVAPILLLFVILPACAPVVSQQLRDRADVALPFAYLMRNPQYYEGRTVIVGGYVLETHGGPEGSELTVLQAPLSSRQRPGASDLSQGRFVAQSSKWLDPEVFRKGRQVTVGGRVLGGTRQTPGDPTPSYPLIEAEEIYLWPQEVVASSPYYGPDFTFYYGYGYPYFYWQWGPAWPYPGPYWHYPGHWR
jgi:outer membrane lipoprotein